ncbi:MAG TPA: hypothetical protein VFU73_01980 [Actinocrinis sp.]|nr:hypothetical protein [Actinocrinis sp.]
MLLRLRIWVADRPGALGQVTRELGACGADIVQVSVLSRERDRALDEITVFLPDEGRRGRLERSLRGLSTVTVEGIRPSGEVPGAFPDLDLLGRVAADPRAALNILVDALPRILAADWALAVRPGAGAAPPSAHVPVSASGSAAESGQAGGGRVALGVGQAAVLARSWDAPHDAALPDLPSRAASVSVGTNRYAAAPVGDTGVLLVVCRVGDPAFHRFEALRLSRLTEVAAAVAGARLVPRATPARGGAGSGAARRPGVAGPGGPGVAEPVADA